MKIQANTTGTRTIEVSEEHLRTISDFHLFDQLTDSNGIVEETVLDRLKMTVRSLLESDLENRKALLDLCLDVIYNTNMKAYGLNQLLIAYKKWKQEKDIKTEL